MTCPGVVARDVGARDVVALLAEGLCGLVGVVVDRLHDALELLVDLRRAPAEALGVLRHLQARRRHAAGVGRLARAVEDLRLHELVDGLERGRHVRALADDLDAVLEQRVRVLAVELVLAGARERAVHRHGPRAAVLVELDALLALRELGELAALHLLELLHLVDEVLRHAALHVDPAGAVGEGDGLGAELDELLRGVLRDVAGAGDRADLALERVALRGEHVRGEVDVSVAGRLGADERAAEGEALAGEHARELVHDALVLAEEVADLAAAHVHVAGRDVRVRADVAVELGHEALAEAHDLRVGAALRVEVRAALAAAHRERGEGVLEDLLEAEELEDREVDGGVEAQAALVGADRAVVLDAVAAVDVELAGVVGPRDAEHDDALGLDEALEDAGVLVLLPRLEHGLEGAEHLGDGLDELRLVGILRLDVGEDFLCVGHGMTPLVVFARPAEPQRAGEGCFRGGLPRVRRNRGARTGSEG